MRSEGDFLFLIRIVEGESEGGDSNGKKNYLEPLVISFLRFLLFGAYKVFSSRTQIFSLLQNEEWGGEGKKGVRGISDS